MNKELVTYRDSKSPVSEMFKTLRTNIQFMNSDKQLKTLLVSSTLPGEGKSWTAANLAVTFAQAGKKVLLIDADMRKGRQFNIFGISPTPGLSNYLSGVNEENIDSFTLEDFVQKTEIENLFVMPAGNVPPNPSELLVSEKMLELNSLVKKIFDITIFDGTPSLIVTDAPILARMVDSTIIVTAHNETKIDNVAKVKKAIENIGGKVAGVVINKVPVTANKYENTYYYGSTMPALRGKRKKQKNEFTWGDDLSNILESDIKTENASSSEETTSETQSWTVDDFSSSSWTTTNETDNETNNATDWEEKEKIIDTTGLNNNSINDSIKEWNNNQVAAAEPVLSWEQNSNTVYQNIDNSLGSETQDVINQINSYLQQEKNKLKNGDFNG